MKKKHKLYLRLNLISIVFIACSFIFTTFAWFAYSGLSRVSTDINVKAWYIEMSKSGEVVSNDIVISLSEIYPGMETLDELVNIKNLGDSDAELSYEIVSARILDNVYEVDGEQVKSESIEDILAHEYPFHVNINLSKQYVLTNDDESNFEVSVSWPLDSGNDILDSDWGMQAYKFQEEEQSKKQIDNNYVVRPAIQIVISVTAEQYVESELSADIRYNLGKTILYDVFNNQVCSELSSTCLKTTVIDTNNTLKEETVTLLPSLYNTYESGTYTNYDDLLNTVTSNWAVTTRPLVIDDVLKVISTDIINSYLVGENISNLVIGSLKYENRINSATDKAIAVNGHYTFLNNKFDYLATNSCYWTKSNYNENSSFALRKQDDILSRLYPEDNMAVCRVVPVIIASKTDLL